jgi:hypothetical protein
MAFWWPPFHFLDAGRALHLAGGTQLNREGWSRGGRAPLAAALRYAAGLPSANVVLAHDAETTTLRGRGLHLEDATQRGEQVQRERAVGGPTRLRPARRPTVTRTQPLSTWPIGIPRRCSRLGVSFRGVETAEAVAV